MVLKINVSSQPTPTTQPVSNKEKQGLRIKIQPLLNSNKPKKFTSPGSIESFPLKVKQCSYIATTSLSPSEDEPEWNGTESWVPENYLKTLVTRCKMQKKDTRALPVKDLIEYSLLIGEDRQSNPSLPVVKLLASPLGAFLSTLGYDVISALHVRGNYSYCFLIEGNGRCSQFLKVFKIEKWDDIASIIYSEERGDPCVLDKAFPYVLAPSQLISLKKNGDISTSGEHGDLLLAHICDVLQTKSDLAEYMDHLSDLYKVRRVFYQILQAVCSLKSEQITHRDLNPANILIDSTDNVRIIDFAYAVKGEELYPPLLSSYAAPCTERSHKIDEFSLGLLLLQMCTGVRPSAKNPLTDKTYREEILEGNLSLSSDIPENLAEIITGLLQIDPQKRLSAEEALKFLAFKPLTISTFL